MAKTRKTKPTESVPVGAEKICASCGRSMAMRRRWARCWDSVRYCSNACRRRGLSDVDTNLERRIVRLLRERFPGSSICPSEVARAEAPGGEWRDLMEPTRRAARRLAHAGVIEVCQGGKAGEPADVRGPIRLRFTS